MKEKNIYQRLNAVMKEVSYVQKSDKKVNNMFRFVTHDSVMAALRGPMVEHGIVMVPSISELTQDGNRTIAKMEIAFVNMDDPVDRIVVTYYGYGIDQQDKGVGKSVSYSVKYALLKVFALETGDDVEKDNIDYVPPSSVREEDLNAMVGELIDLFPPEEMTTASKYIENWKVQLKASQGTKWLEGFKKGLEKSLSNKEKFGEAVAAWNKKQGEK